MQTFGATRSAYSVATLLRGFENTSGTDAVPEREGEMRPKNTTGKSDALSYAAVPLKI
jgi:hypothetical protein